MAGSSPTVTYSEGVKWLIGLSGAAVAGAFLHYDQLAVQNIYIRLPVAVAAGFFIFSIWCGVYYLVWLNTVAVEKERVGELGEQLKTADDESKMDLEGRLKKSKDKINAGEATMPSWRFLFTRSFAVGLIVSGSVLVLALVLHQTPPAPPISEPGRFAVTYSAVHKTSHGREAHTFLLDQKTGDLWMMVCQPNSKVVFQHVERTESTK